MFVSWKEGAVDFGDFLSRMSLVNNSLRTQWDFFFLFARFLYISPAVSVFFSLFLPVVLPSKQSTANSFGQMQITSLTSQPKSILQQERWANVRKRRRREKTERRKCTHTKKRQPDKTSAGFAHLCQAEKAKLAGRGRREREGDWEVVGEEKRKEEEMEAWCPRQQVPGIVFWGGEMHHNEGGGRAKIHC